MRSRAEMAKEIELIENKIKNINANRQYELIVYWHNYKNGLEYAYKNGTPKTRSKYKSMIKDYLKMSNDLIIKVYSPLDLHSMSVYVGWIKGLEWALNSKGVD